MVNLLLLHSLDTIPKLTEFEKTLQFIKLNIVEKQDHQATGTIRISIDARDETDIRGVNTLAQKIFGQQQVKCIWEES